MSMVSFYTPGKHQETTDFLTFSGCMERLMAWNGLQSSLEQVKVNLKIILNKTWNLKLCSKFSKF